MKPVKFVSFHSPLFIPELGNVGENLPSSKKALPGLQMFDTGSGVSFTTGGHSGFIPAANCKIWIYGPEPKPAAKGKA